MSFDLTNKNIKDTFQNLLQRTGSDNRLYDLLGNEIGNLRISGSLIAQQYIVSSSVTNITTQQLSGSTQFGDSSDDTHLFTGNITASGEISASGRVTTLQVGKDSTDQIDFSTDNVLIFRTGNNNRLRLTTGALRPNAAGGIKLGTTGTPFGALHLQGDITASGNISSSGTITGNAINVNGTNVLVAGGVDISADTNLVAGTNITLAGDTLNVDDAFLKNNTDDTTSGVITAGGFTTAGNISASGDITGSDIFASSGFYGTLQTAAQPNITSLGDLTILTVDDISINGSEISTNANFLTLDAQGDIVLNADGGDINFKDNTVTLGGVNNSGIFSNNNITASGNISASGNLFVNEITAGNTLSIGNTTVLKKSFTTDNDGLNFKSGSTTMATFANSTGNFGIGTTTPTKKLQVTGDISASGTIFNSNITSIGNTGNISGFNTIAFQQAGDPTITLTANSVTIGDPDDANNETKLIVDDANKKVTTNVPLVVSSHITASGNISSSITSTGSFGKLIGDGSSLTGLTSAAISTYNSSGNDRIITSVNSSTVQGESNLTFNSSNQLTVNGDISSSGDILNSQVVQMTNSSSVIDTFNTGSFRSAKYTLQVTSASNYQVSEMLVLHNDGAALSTEYAQINSGLNLLSFTTSVSSNFVKLNAVGNFISCSVRYERTIIPN